MYETRLAKKGDMPLPKDRYNDVATEIRRLIQETHDASEGFRAYGSAWSMSNIAHNKDRMHFNAPMNISFMFSAQDLHTQSPFDHDNLFMFECGNIIKEVTNKLEANGKSLKTTGASNGQTIVGCISTGVHGSAIDVGSVQDYVVGLNIITGPNPEDVVYLERHSKPALNDAFAQSINAKVIRNDGLFNAALVGLGAFGFIHGVVIEAEDRYLLKRYVKQIDKNVALELAKTLDFKNSSFTIPGETDGNGKGNRPYHYKVFLNQYKNDDKYIVEFIYKKPYATPYPDPRPLIEKSIYRDLIGLIISLSEQMPKIIPTFINLLKNSLLPSVDEESIGTLGQTFWDALYKGPAFAISFGVDHRNSDKALKLLSDVTINEGPVPGIFAARFIKKSNATLSFAKFPTTCMIEIDGVLWKDSDNIISLTTLARRMIETLKANNIPFTMHWGKNSDWAFPGLVNHMYGNKAKEWKTFRSALLSEDMQKLFSNDFLETVKLSNRETPIPPDLIASLI